MDSRVPEQHYEMGPGGTYIGSSPAGDDVEGDAVTEDGLGDAEESNSVDCLRDSYRHSPQLVGVDEGHSGIDSSGNTSRSLYGILAVEDIVPIEAARARFLEIIVNSFVKEHVIEVENSDGVDYGFGHGKLDKRKPKDVQYEGDPRFVLPLMYVANLYEALVSEVNMRLTTLDGIREKTIGVALEAAGGLYRKLAKKFPRNGLYSYKRRELATSLETRTRFPELVVQEEKRVRFVVVNGLEIVEKPNSVTLEDAEWFKRLTGRHEVAISSRDFKFYSPRHKHRRAVSSVPNNSKLPAYDCSDDSSTIAATSGLCPDNEQQMQPQQSSSKQQIQPLHLNDYHSIHQARQTFHHDQHTTQFSHMHPCQNSSNLSDISGSHQQSIIPQHMIGIQALPGGHLGGRLHLLPTSPAKFCDQCGTPYLRETSKFCSECGTKRLGI